MNTGNIAVSGLGLYVILGAVSIGIDERCLGRLSHFLEQDVEELYDIRNWRRSRTAKKWIYLRSAIQEISKMISIYISSYYPEKHYERILRSIFNIIPTNVNMSNSSNVARVIKNWLSSNMYESVGNIIDESLLDENSALLIYTLYYRPDWVANFDAQKR
ncbi:hypothetical protein RF11_10726 [Thelohanellus kitauei]|uniref:Serpin domain-containing protein n=1 Tax=Thelohanellus kitauei TaxID=669202 RepID=A0A0C2MET2_THEKT|nr:hypothetical protein RF11_10726 [Thelohanellus kitauei]